ncbi:hypothetical protein PBN151_2621 [Paenibacillus sp. NAIST15-1]|nr:hypothetical protein PBN151_2621 [Paenibacillus sp. NAIST15-1]
MEYGDTKRQNIVDCGDFASGFVVAYVFVAKWSKSLFGRGHVSFGPVILVASWQVHRSITIRTRYGSVNEDAHPTSSIAPVPCHV